MMDLDGLGIMGAESNALRYDRIIADRYQIVRKIGQGGMGAVFFAKDLQDNMRPCAIKLLKYEAAQDLTETQRFRNESIITLGLKHRNLVSVLDIGIGRSEEFYIVMEYVDGGTLGEQLERDGSMDFEQTLATMHQIACGLNHSHASKVVHRDLKPDNILIDNDEVYKITDFGLAKSQDIRDSLTKTGETVGTPFYMAPEQFRGETPSPLNDIYSLGVMSFEFASGVRPFFHENYVALATMHLNNPLPRISEFGITVPKWFQELVEACTEKKQKNRLQSMEEVAGYLEYQMELLGIEFEERIASPVAPEPGFLDKIGSMLGI